MESEMVQNSTSNFSITFNKHDQIQDTNFIRINKCMISFNLRNLINFNKVKNPITTNKKKNFAPFRFPEAASSGLSKTDKTA